MKQLSSRDELINQSWGRCLERNLERAEAPMAQNPSLNQVKEIKEENEILLEYSVPILNELRPYLVKNNHVTSLLDRHGHVIYTIGSDQLAEQEELADLKQKGNLREGINWNEHYKGTNAAGIALKEQTPIILFGEEHFYKENAALTCAANPIIAPTGEAVGVINIYSIASLFNESSLTMGKLAAETIQHKLMFQNVTNEKILAFRELNHLSDHYHEPIISLDQDSYIIRANESAKSILGTDCVGRLYNNEYPVEVIGDKWNKWWRSYTLKTPASEYKRNQPNSYTFSDIKRKCHHVEKQIKLAAKVAVTDLPLILQGETGTGKEVFAQSIHAHSDRKHKPFITVNCGAIPEHLIESELFGYEKGAFTGAHPQGKKGKFEAAHGGTLFLDEIGELPLQAQVALLRVLQEKEITPLGSNQTKTIDVRIIAATNCRLPEEVNSKQFRADLFYRLKGIIIDLIPLRERTDCIYLAEAFLEEIDPLTMLSSNAKEAIVRYQWPGNIRELISVLNQGVFLAESGVIKSEDLQLSIAPEAGREYGGAKTLEEIEKETIERTLEYTEGNIKKAAERLNITRTRLYRKINQYNLKPSS
ncbi:sigma-54-dependent Fis family transcriptional regulator [Salibacterium aidingense]|uniref:sigma-54-dependent Fis family transcriptional regulator n=1 Tax=Salibacterium aidingense TaxID=384933 RepID=UPI0003F9095D|nr:sigma-54-dependent Fis family transcriptional regulator [Salibacterium aidingense]